MKLFSPRIPDLLPRRLPLFSFSPAVIPPVSAALPICHPASEWRERAQGKKEGKEEVRRIKKGKGRKKRKRGRRKKKKRSKKRKRQRKEQKE